MITKKHALEISRRRLPNTSEFIQQIEEECFETVKKIAKNLNIAKIIEFLVSYFNEEDLHPNQPFKEPERINKLLHGRNKIT